MPDQPPTEFNLRVIIMVCNICIILIAVGIWAWNKYLKLSVQLFSLEREIEKLHGGGRKPTHTSEQFSAFSPSSGTITSADARSRLLSRAEDDSKTSTSSPTVLAPPPLSSYSPSLSPTAEKSADHASSSAQFASPPPPPTPPHPTSIFGDMISRIFGMEDDAVLSPSDTTCRLEEESSNLTSYSSRMPDWSNFMRAANPSP